MPSPDRLLHDARAWCGAAPGPAALVGNPHSLFVREMAGYLRALGMDVAIVTCRQWYGPDRLPDGTRVVCSERSHPERLETELVLLTSILQAMEAEVHRADPERVREALRAWEGPCPTVVAPIWDAISIARAVRELRPRFVLGQEVFAYGLATALSTGAPRILMPWGGDIYLFAETSALAFALVQYSLRSVDLVWSCSVSAARRLRERFGVPAERILAGSWGVDVDAFKPADPSTRASIRSRFRIDPSALLVMNARRFRPAWGSETVLGAFLRVAREHPSAHFLLMGGSGGREPIAAAREAARRAGVEARFTLFEEDVPFAECRELMSVADIFVSLMRAPDLRSAGIMQAAAAGGAPVLSDQPEYREMIREGFRARLAPIGDAGAVADAILACAVDDALRRDTVAANRSFLAQHEARDQRMAELLNRIAAAGAEAMKA